MTQTTYTIDDTMIGAALPVVDGFLTDLKRTGVGPYEVPSFDEGRQHWTRGYFILRGSGDIRDLICLSPSQGSGWASHSPGGDTVWINASVPFKGSLTVVSCPRGSTWEVTLSDVPYVKKIESFADYVARLRNSPAVSKLVSASAVGAP